MQPIILIKYGEIALKGKNRHLYEKKLMANISNATGINRKNIILRHGRIYLHDPSKIMNSKQKQMLISNLKNVFGMEGFAFAYNFTKDLAIEQIKNVAVEIFSKFVNKSSQQSFKIYVRRINKSFPIKSMKLAGEIGSSILANFSHLTVNLNHPDLSLFVECRDEGIIIYNSQEHYTCHGGLPIGMSGNGILLLSGGIDSPVAGWMMSKRGMSLDAIHFHSPPFTGEKAKQKVIDLCYQLAKWKQQPINLYLSHFTDIQNEINANCPPQYWTIMHRRFMLRLAEKITQLPCNHAKKYCALITGDSLSQVASQTIENIAVINNATKLPILRPLIGMNKLEIINLANKIGTFAISKLPYADCCTLLSSNKPATKAWEDQIIAAECVINTKQLIDDAIARLQLLAITPR